MRTIKLRKRFFRYSVALVLLVTLCQLLLFACYEIFHEFVEEEEYWHSLVEDRSVLEQLERKHLLHELQEVGVLTVISILSAPFFIWFVHFMALRTLKPIEDVVDVVEEMEGTERQPVLPVYDDPDEIGTLVAALNRAFSRYQAALEQARRFSSDASHQLRTPLAVVRSAVEVTLSRPRSEEVYRAALQQIFSQTLLLEHIVEQLLLLARMRKEELEGSFRPVDLKLVLAELDDRFRVLAEDRGIRWKVSNGLQATLSGEASLLLEAFSNLVNNALNVTPANGHVTVDLQVEDSTAHIQVCDSGPGIAAADQKRIFDRFYRSDAVPYEGSGLGLSIVDAVVDLHGGRITFETSAEGTCFAIQLPLNGSVPGQVPEDAFL